MWTSGLRSYRGAAQLVDERTVDETPLALAKGAIAVEGPVGIGRSVAVLDFAKAYRGFERQ
jgi:hypothetical protein